MRPPHDLIILDNDSETGIRVGAVSVLLPKIACQLRMANAKNLDIRICAVFQFQVVFNPIGARYDLRRAWKVSDR
jgi:hypothetical protein